MMTTKISFIGNIILLILALWLLWDNNSLSEENLLLSTSSESLKAQLEQSEKDKEAYKTQNQELAEANKQYMSDIQRNKEVIESSKQIPIDKNKVVDDETTKKIINILNNSFTYGL